MNESDAVMLNESELEYHEKMIANVSEINSINQEIQNLQTLSFKKSATVESWGEHLKEKYHLNDGDIVDDLGKIVYAKTEEVTDGVEGTEAGTSEAPS